MGCVPGIDAIVARVSSRNRLVSSCRDDDDPIDQSGHRPTDLRGSVNNFLRWFVAPCDPVAFVAVATVLFVPIALSTPGETMDAISVWPPDKRALLPGDDFLPALRDRVGGFHGNAFSSRHGSRQNWVA